MNIKSPEDIKNDSAISIEQAWKMFDALFLDPEKKDIVAKLFEGFPWFIREQKVNDAIKTAKWWLQDLKNTIV